MSTTYLPLQQYGLKVKFIDIDLETLNLDLKQLKKQFQQKQKQFSFKNLLGNPVNINELNEFVIREKIYILEDNS